VLLPNARKLPDFALLDHNHNVFSNKDLVGAWHLVSYGFTTCPDICPTTLSELAWLSRSLRAEGFDDLRVLFYTVDHRRDTSAQLASYLPFFDASFIGLTHEDDDAGTYLPFEQGLGIVARLVPASDADPEAAGNDYQVLHGVTLYLLNPDGDLQAIFQPGKQPGAAHGFDPDTLKRDYLAVRTFLD
jgi:protein SCO1/2